MINFIFFGSSRFSTIVLDELGRSDFVPKCIITTPDKPKGRGLKLTPTPVKEWAIKRKISIYDPSKLDGAFIEKLNSLNAEGGFKIFVVASYGKIIPKAIIDMPDLGTLNVHPSLLPKYRGASPLQSAMLDDAKKSGISIIKIDGQMDHGPIVAQTEVTVNEWPIYEDYEEMMAKKGGQLLAKTIPIWIAGKIKEHPQDHSRATYTKKIVKEDGLVDLNDDPYFNFRKIQALHEWPRAYFIHSHNGKKIRVKITRASFKENHLIIEKVIPEGNKEISHEDFPLGYGQIQLL